LPISGKPPSDHSAPGEPAGADSANADLESEVRQSRKYSMEDAIGRLAGPGSLKGASPVSRQQQAENEISGWLCSNLEDPAGALRLVLARQLEGSQALLGNLDRPLAVLTDHCERMLASDSQLRELVREADVEWARLMDERPHFEQAGASPHRDDPYTIGSVRALLKKVVQQLHE
jgi:hypothetical protein